MLKYKSIKKKKNIREKEYDGLPWFDLDDIHE
jgi:hypothetical protein